MYASAAPHFLVLLNPVQNQALRLAPGAILSPPVPSLEVEANVMPLDLRRELIAARSFLSAGSHPLWDCLAMKGRIAWPNEPVVFRHQIPYPSLFKTSILRSDEDSVSLGTPAGILVGLPEISWP